MVPVVLIGAKVTLLVGLAWIRVAFPPLRIDVGDLVDMLDTEEPAVVTVCCKMDEGALVPMVDRDDADECFGFKEKPEASARL